MLKIPHKTIIMINEENYLVYIGSFLFKEIGQDYTKEKKYIKELVKQLWNKRSETPRTLKDAEKIETIKEVFEIHDLEII